MTLNQRLEVVKSDYYDDLAIEIKNWIDTLEDSYEIQQIDYFNMDEKDGATCVAFILFRKKIGN